MIDRIPQIHNLLGLNSNIVGEKGKFEFCLRNSRY